MQRKYSSGKTKYESEVNRRDLKQEILSMADIQELVLTFLESLSDNALRFNRTREISSCSDWHDLLNDFRFEVIPLTLTKASAFMLFQQYPLPCPTPALTFTLELLVKVTIFNVENS